MAEDEKYFLSENELRLWFNKGDFTQHFTVRHQLEPLSFEYLEIYKHMPYLSASEMEES